MPYNVGAHDSSEFNWASGMLDRLTFARSVQVEQVTELDHACMDRIFMAWLDEALLIDGYLPAAMPPFAEWVIDWHWDALDDVDQVKAANGAKIRLFSGQSSFTSEGDRRGRESEMAQMAEDLGLTLKEYRRRLADKLLGPDTQQTNPNAPPKQKSNARQKQTA